MKGATTIKVLKKIFDKIFTTTTLWLIGICTAFAGCFMSFIAGSIAKPDPKPEVVAEQKPEPEPVEAASTSEEA